MPTTRKQKNTRKSRALEMLSDIENLDEMLGEMHSGREESVNSISARRQEAPVAICLKTWKKTCT